ncbi:hypothetical protein TNCV_1464251 [Trichonephila clavipes]|nr:hypothetical protein TNCV_1464251 [Trichonephila clavipes]
MLELIPNKTTDEPKDLILTSSNHTSRPETPQDSTCKRRLALSEELSQLTLAVQATNTAINNYKAHGVFHIFFIALQLQLQAVYEKYMQHVIGEIFSLPPCDTPACTFHTSPNNTPVNKYNQDFPPFPKPMTVKRKESVDGFTSHTERYRKTPDRTPTRKLILK